MRRTTALLTAVLALAAIPGTAAAAVTGQVGTFNLAGHTKNDGSTKVAEDMVRSMQARRPTLVMLQEACYTQFHHLRARLASVYAGRFFKVPGEGCDTGSYGNAVLWRKSALAVNHVKQYPLGSLPGLEQRQMGCVKSDRPRVVACTVHLTPPFTDNKPDARKAQSQAREMAAVARTTRGWATKYPVIAAGDFNAAPGDPLMNAMYFPDYGGGAGGIFREVDDLGARDGEPTHDGRKIDYVFFTRNIRWHWGDVVDSLRSDHRTLWGALTIR